MKVYKEINLEDFEPWSGAVSRFNDAKDRGLLPDIEAYLEDIFEGGYVSETDINDFFWFDYDSMYGEDEEEEEEEE